MDELSTKISWSYIAQDEFNASCLSLSMWPSLYRLKGELVDIKDTIKGFNMIMDGEMDHLPEAAFNW